MALAQGTALAVVAKIIPFLGFVFGYLAVLVHELGHTATAWLFGYPSIPAFDFAYGGGLTVHQERAPGLVVVVYAGLAVLFHYLRRNRTALMLVALAAVAYTLAAFTPLHQVLIVSMGHGSELVFAGIFLYRAASGAACRVRLERPAYAFCGMFLVLHDLLFAWSLLQDPVQRAVYEDAKGGGHWMDLSRLAGEFLGTDLATVAAGLVLACAIPLPLALLAHRYRDRWLTAVGSALEPDPREAGSLT